MSERDTLHINIGPITLTSASIFLDFWRRRRARHCKLSFTPITRDGSIPRLFLLVELPVLDLVVEAGRLLAGDRVLNVIGSDGTVTLSNSSKKARTTDFPAYIYSGYSDKV